MCIDYFDSAELSRWFSDNGDQTHRLDYQLNKDSLVLDLGGYMGEWSSKISDRYKCNILIFEPVKEFYFQLMDKFKNNHKVEVYNFGLSDSDRNSYIIRNEASSSLYLKEGNKEEIGLVRFSEYVRKNKIEFIDLIKINIEGSEYDLLDHLIEENLQSKIKNLQIQFHKISRDSEARREKIRKKLSKTHTLTYNYNFVWENWEKV
jgi:FkbM family methyltransferase